MYDGQGNAPKPTIAEVQRTVCAGEGVTMEEMTCERRFPRLVGPRQIAMFLAREMTGKSLHQMARAFNRHWATIIWAEKRVRLKHNELAEKLDLYRGQIMALAEARVANAPAFVPPPPEEKVRTSVRWSMSETARLRRLWSQPMTIKEIARELPGREPGAIKSYASKIGLPHKRDINAARELEHA